MRDHFLSRLLRALPFAPRGRRLIDETLRDWDHEVAAASGGPERVAAFVLGSLGISRAIAAAVAYDAAAIPALWMMTRLLLFTGLPALLIVIGLQPQLTPVEQLATTGTILSLRTLAVINHAELLLPVGFFLAMAWPSSRRLPIIGVSVAAVAVTLLFTIWIAPAAEFYRGVINASEWNLFHPAGPLQLDPRDNYFPYYALTFIRKSSYLGPLVGELPFRVGLAVLAGSLAAYGSLLRSARLPFRRLALVAIALATLGGLSVLTGGTAALLSYDSMSFLLNSDALWPCRLAFWLCATVAVVLWIRRMRWYWTAAASLGVAGLIAALPTDWRGLYSLLGAGYAAFALAVVVIALALFSRRTALSTRPRAVVRPGQSVDSRSDEQPERPDALLLFRAPSDPCVNQAAGLVLS